MTELNVVKRDEKTKVSALREEGKIPAVFYGPKEDSTPIILDAREFVQVWNQAGGSSIVDLRGVGEDKEILIHDVTWHPVKGTPTHVDLYCIERGKKLNVSVPLEFVGEAPAEKEGGIVVKVMHELEIEVKPRDIPQKIEVDLTLLSGLDSSITIADLNLPESIEPVQEKTEAVASVTQAQTEPEEEEERDISDIEIEGERDTEKATEKKGTDENNSE
ncbi:50S ribosomal protein L25 [bacterium]|nr:50S ribosomal protein L25 [bacterium]|tara:strand:+ start:10189 stop:10842 length:654 start_codon:yes stop_codon:yes gene_type:complete